MLKAVVFLEALVLLAAAVWTWRRARPASAPYGRPLLTTLAWILVQAALLAAGYYAFLNRLETAGPDLAARIASAAWPVYAIQALRALVLVLAAGAWLRILKSVRLDRRGKGFLAAALALSWFAPLPGSVFLFILLMRMKWVESLPGWGRLAALGGAVAGFLALLVWPVTRVAGGMAQTALYGLTDARSVPLIQGELPPGALAPMALASPFDFTIRFLTDILRVQAVALVLQLLALPVHLRNLSLKRRFGLAFSLYRVIPGLLTGLVMLAGVYFGLGLYKSRIVNHAFLDTINRGRIAAGLVLAAGSEGYIDAVAAEDAARTSSEWVAFGGADTHFVLRRVELPATPAGQPDSLSKPILATLGAWSSPGTPEHLLAASVYGGGESDTVAGLFVSDGRFYIASALARKLPGEALVSEVYVPVDSLYLRALAARAGADIHLQALSGVRISSSALQFGSGEETKATTPEPGRTAAAREPDVTVSATFGAAGKGLFKSKHLVARQFLPLLDRRHSAGEFSGSTALLTLTTSPILLARGIIGAPYVFSSNIFAIGLFLAVLVLFAIAESSAVRTGRSIIEGILEDAKGLAAAAKRFGSGDLDYRIAEPGKDELGQLASAFNAMAADLKLRQEELIEKERLEADLALARRIQERLLPQGPPSVPGLDVAGISIPSLEVGGDLFHFLPLKGDRLGLAIGDVAGKSIPAALLMSNALAILRATTRMENDVADVLTQMNALIAEQVEPGKFLTFFYTVVDPHAHRLRYACAGHNPPLVVRADGAAEWLEQGGPPLGILPNTVYTAAEVALLPGDVLVLYSDGLTEAERPKPGVTEAASPDDEEYFGEERLLEAARTCHGESARGILDGLIASVQAYVGDAPQSDDLTVVVVKVRGESA